MEKKVRKVIKYENLTPELLEAIAKKYPAGWEEQIIKVTGPNNTIFYAFMLEMPEASYLVKVNVKIDSVFDDESEGFEEDRIGRDDDSFSSDDDDDDDLKKKKDAASGEEGDEADDDDDDDDENEEDEEDEENDEDDDDDEVNEDEEEDEEDEKKSKNPKKQKPVKAQPKAQPKAKKDKK